MADSAMLTPPPSPDSARFDHGQVAGKFQEHAEGRWIKLPEALFSSIMSVEPEINPLYRTSKALSDDWLRR